MECTVSCLWSSMYEWCPGSAASLCSWPLGFHCGHTDMVERLSEGFGVNVIFKSYLFLTDFCWAILILLHEEEKNVSEIPVWLSWLNMRFACLFRGFMNIFSADALILKSWGFQRVCSSLPQPRLMYCPQGQLRVAVWLHWCSDGRIGDVAG